MKPTVLLFMAFGLAMTALAVPRVVALWRGHTADYERWVATLGTLIGKPLARGAMRAIVLVIVQLLATIALLVIGPLVETAYPLALDAFVILFGMVYLGIWVLIGFIILVNKPKSLVPPVLRREPGAIAELFGRQPPTVK